MAWAVSTDEDERDWRTVVFLELIGAPHLVGVGLVLGLAGAFAATRFLQSLLFGVEATDWTTFATVAAVLSAIGLLASSIPARRATRVDPQVALRCE